MSFSSRKSLLGAFVAVLLLGLTTNGRAQNPQPLACSPKQLDVKVSPQIQRETRSDLHWLAVEIQNRDQVTCLLGLLAVNFTPDNNKPWGSGPTTDTSQAALAFKQKSQQLAAGEVAHMLLGWSSAPIQVGGLIVDILYRAR